jgi:hypothetical protein
VKWRFQKAWLWTSLPRSNLGCRPKYQKLIDGAALPILIFRNVHRGLGVFLAPGFESSEFLELDRHRA